MMMNVMMFLLISSSSSFVFRSYFFFLLESDDNFFFFFFSSFFFFPPNQQQATAIKFVSESLPSYKTGGIEAAARGLCEFMMVDESDMDMWRRTITDMDAAEGAIINEVRKYQSRYEPDNNAAQLAKAQTEAEQNDAEGMVSLLDYVMNQPSSEKEYVKLYICLLFIHCNKMLQ